MHLPDIERAGRPVIIFLTVNARHRKPVLANAEAFHVLRSVWTRANTWCVGRYVLLPEHIHMFCSPVEPGVSLMRWVTYWKSLATKLWPRPEDKPLWQRDFWDRQLRSQESYDEKWEYVRQNPVRRGLVEDADEWPFAGELCCLPWRES